MSDAAVHSKKFGEERQQIVDKLKDKGNENLADILETTTASKLAKDDFIDGLTTTFPEAKSELLAINAKAQKLQEEGVESYDYTQYFQETGNGTRFEPVWLAEDIMEDYDFLWVNELEKLFVWKDNHWQENAERLIKEECNTRLGEEHRINRTREVIGKIESESSIPKHEFRPVKHKVYFQNGALNLETGELEKHSPQNFNAFLIPWDYDPDAQCPEIHEFLNEVTNSEEDKETLIEAAGSVMLPDLLGKAFMLTGKGMNGKGKFLDIVKKMTGEKDYKEEDLQRIEEGRFASKELFQKLAWISDDLPPTKLKTGSTFKSIVDGTDTRGEFKGGAHFQFKNYATPIFAANEIPDTDDQSDGFFRRWIIINFPYQFRENPDEDNPRHKQKIPEKQLDKQILSDEEILGFVNEAATALQVIYEDGRYTHAQTIDEVREMWNTYANPVDTFIERYLQQGVTQSEARRRNENAIQGTEVDFDYIEKDMLYELVCIYCENRDTRPPTMTTLTQKLNKSRLFVSNTRSRAPGEDSSRVQIYRGVSFSDQFWEDLEGVHGVQGFQTLTRDALEAKNSKLLNELEKKYGHRGHPRDDILESLQHEGKVSEQDLIEQLDYSEDRIVCQLEQLKSEGELFEPESGFVEKV